MLVGGCLLLLVLSAVVSVGCAGCFVKGAGSTKDQVLLMGQHCRLRVEQAAVHFGVVSVLKMIGRLNHTQMVCRVALAYMEAAAIRVVSS